MIFDLLKSKTTKSPPLVSPIFHLRSPDRRSGHTTAARVRLPASRLVIVFVGGIRPKEKLRISFIIIDSSIYIPKQIVMFIFKNKKSVERWLRRPVVQRDLFVDHWPNRSLCGIECHGCVWSVWKHESRIEKIPKRSLRPQHVTHFCIFSEAPAACLHQNHDNKLIKTRSVLYRCDPTSKCQIRPHRSVGALKRKNS